MPPPAGDDVFVPAQQILPYSPCDHSHRLRAGRIHSAAGTGPGTGAMDGQRAGRAATVVLWILPVLVGVTWALVSRWDVPSDGTTTLQSADGWSRGAVRVDTVPARDSPLRPGDRVVAVDGIPLERIAAGGATFRTHLGQVVTYTVVRPAGEDSPGDARGDARGDAHRLDVAVRLGRYPLLRALGEHLPGDVLVVTMYLVATFVVTRRPWVAAARVLYQLAVVLPLTLTAFPMAPQVIEVATGRLWPLVVGDLANCVLWGSVLHFALVFPEVSPDTSPDAGSPGILATPRPLLRLRRPAVVAGYLVPYACYLLRLAFTLPGLDDPLARLRVFVVVSQWAAPVQPVLIAVALVVGYRSATDALVRRRMRWAFVAVGVAAVSYLGLGQIPVQVVGHPLMPWDFQAVAFVPFPVALGLAVLRYRLFDIEIILRRSLVLGALTAVLGSLYVSVVAAASRFPALPEPAAPFVASVAVALLFGPLRSRARRAVSRSLFGDRDDPFEVMDRLGQRLTATAPAQSVLTTVVETLAEALRLSHAAIRLSDVPGQEVAFGHPAGRSVLIPITHAGELVGELQIDPGPHREPFGLTDQRLLDGLARQLGVISRNLVLEMQVHQSLERVVTAREEERRRLRRDLHDGLGPVLATTAMQVDLAAQLIDRDPARARQILAGLGGVQREAVAGLRKLVEGLRPAVLDRLGLVGALRDGAHAFTLSDDAGGLVVDVDADPDVEPLPAAVEVAAYRLAHEALTNVVRHAEASHCLVRLQRDGEALLVEVTDDGAGLPDGYRAGVGLTAIRERAAELGGTVSVTPGPDGGTAVRARLPVRSWDGS